MAQDNAASRHVSVEAWLPQFVENLAARAGEAEALSKLPEATIAEAAAAGYFSSLVPKAFDGQEIGFGAFLDITRRMAQGCTSSAWTLSFLALHAWLLCKFEPELQKELFANGKIPRAPAPLAPTGQAVPVEGGYSVSGRWEWATGIMHGDWIMVCCIEPGALAPRFCVLPTSDVIIEDNWRTAGMAATGSNAVRIENIFVPAHRTLDAIRLKFGKSPGEAFHDCPLLAYPLGPTLALVAATPALGAAEAAVSAFTVRMKEKLQAYSGLKQGELPTTHLRLGEAIATLHAAQLVWRDAIRELEVIGPQGNEAPVDSLVAIRLASADIVRLANVTINGLAASAGASSGYLSSPLQRTLRDVQMMRGHVVFDRDRAAQSAGKVALGTPPTLFDML